jgi:hypothetical protein
MSGDQVATAADRCLLSRRMICVLHAVAAIRRAAGFRVFLKKPNSHLFARATRDSPFYFGN